MLHAEGIGRVMRGHWRIAGLVALAFVLLVTLNNTSWLARTPAGPPVLLAHRGIAQRFDEAGVTARTCTASRMLPPRNPYLENTLPSMRAAFAAGADIVEFDVHPTTDGKFVVFHDWTLDCRTNGHGVTRGHSLAELKRLDIGYGYTADGGRTFPFRGKGVGLMPSLDEVLTAFPERRFLINVKSNDAQEGELLSRTLQRLPEAARAKLMVYGGDKPIAVIAQEVRGVKTMSRSSLQACGMRYIAYGWTGMVPAACRGRLLFLPINIAPWLWGWPNRLLARMRSVDAEVFVVGPYHGGGFTTGIDTADDLARLPDAYAGGVLTNEIVSAARSLKHRL
jgi:glycerophosphoryl diester phosphodiesterase